MSTSVPSTTSTTSTSATGYALSSLGGTNQITGLASGLDTDQIIQEEMAIYQQPVTNLQNEVTGVTATNTQLSNLQSQLQSLSADALAVGDPTLFDDQQSVTSSDSTRVGASMTSNSGAGVGGYEVSVSQLANSAQRTFTYNSTNASQFTIDNQQVSITAGESVADFVQSINSNSKLDVYAASVGNGQVVLSNRATGDTGSNYIQVQGAGSTLAEITADAREGQNAEYSVDGTSGTSASNTVTNAIGGVTLTLNGLTTSSGPVTVDVAAPAPDSDNIQSAINTFVTQYNSVISAIQTQLSQQPSSSDPTQGTLYGDSELNDLLSSMRSAMYSSASGLSAGMANMLDVGVSTGATTGSGAVSQSALSGTLTLNASTLTSALASNPAGVQSVLSSWSQSFTSLVDNEADPGGAIAARIQGDDSQINDLNNQISSMQSALTDKQNTLVQQFAQLEAALSSNQSTSSWLTSQIASLPGA